MRMRLVSVIVAWWLLSGVSGALALPDARIVRVGAEGSNLCAGDRVPLTVEIRNAGDEPLPPVPVTLNVNDKPYAEWKLPNAVGPNKAVVWSLIWRAAAGSHLVVATVDPLNEVVESNEANNSGFINLGVTEPGTVFPWSAFVYGVASFLIAAGTAFVLRWLGRRPPSRSAKPT